MWINTVRGAGKVERFHTKPLLHRQDISQHSFNAMFIALEVMRNVEEVNRERVILYCASHDLPEVCCGDAPGNSKADNPELKEILDRIEKEWVNENCPEYIRQAFIHLSHKEKVICKAADLLEALQTALIEVRLGNDVLKSAVNQIWEALAQKLIEAEKIDLTVANNADKILVWLETEYSDEFMKSV